MLNNWILLLAHTLWSIFKPIQDDAGIILVPEWLPRKQKSALEFEFSVSWCSCQRRLCYFQVQIHPVKSPNFTFSCGIWQHLKEKQEVGCLVGTKTGHPCKQWPCFSVTGLINPRMTRTSEATTKHPRRSADVKVPLSDRILHSYNYCEQNWYKRNFRQRCCSADVFPQGHSSHSKTKNVTISTTEDFFFFILTECIFFFYFNGVGKPQEFQVKSSCKRWSPLKCSNLLRLSVQTLPSAPLFVTWG